MPLSSSVRINVSLDFSLLQCSALLNVSYIHNMQARACIASPKSNCLDLKILDLETCSVSDTPNYVRGRTSRRQKCLQVLYVGLLSRLLWSNERSPLAYATLKRRGPVVANRDPPRTKRSLRGIFTVSFTNGPINLSQAFSRCIIQIFTHWIGSRLPRLWSSIFLDRESVNPGVKVLLQFCYQRKTSSQKTNRKRG